MNIGQAFAVERGFRLAGDDQHPGGGVLRLVEAGDHVGGARSGTGDHHAQIAGRARIAVRRMRAGAFVAGIDDLRLTETIDGVEDGHVVDADDAEHVAHAKVGQALGNEVRAGVAHGDPYA